MTPRRAARIRQAAQARCRPGTIARTSVLSWLLLLLTAALPAPGRAAGNPLAHDAATVVSGKARFTVLTPRLIRMELSEDARFEDRASLAFINRRLPVPEYEVERSEGWLRIATDTVTLRYRLGADAFDKQSLQVEFAMDGEPRRWMPGMPADGNLQGTTRTLDGFDGAVRLRDGLPLAIEPGLVSRDGWALVDDSRRLLFEGDPADNRLSPRRPGGRIDWYLFTHGHDYKGALADFVAVAGRIPMPPRYAFGYWWSRYWPYSDAELRELVGTIRGYDIPLDVLIVDMDWHETHGLTSRDPAPTPFGGMLGWTGYTWDRDLFPEPRAFLDWTASERLKVALNLHPSDGIAPFEDDYARMRAALGDAAPPDGEWIEYRLSDPAWAEAYFETMLRPHERLGVDFWWLDWQQWPESRHVPGLDNTFWLNHAFWSDRETAYPERRPLLFHRWGGLGNHRYQVGFSGDVVISWKSLEFQPGFTATAANVAYGYWSHDIGGHIAADRELATDGELYLRWIQFGALSPIFRTHSSKSDVAERRIWKYPRYFAAMRDAIRLRYTLAPYLYGAARQAYDSGVSMIRPMYYDYPEEERAYQARGQYMLGDDLLVAPVTSPVDPETRLAAQTVWLPEGRWYEWDSGRLLDGSRTIQRTVALDEIPLYVKAGSIVPMLPPGQADLQHGTGRIVFTIFPGGDDRLAVYEDDGVGQGYRNGEAAWTTVTAQRGDDTLSLSIGDTQGRFDDMPAERQVTLRIAGVAPVDEVRVDGERLADGRLGYDAATLTQIVRLPPLAVANAHEIEVQWAPGQGASAAQLAGKAGLFRRLRELGTRVKVLAAREDWAATVPDELSRLIGTPTRIGYHPGELQAEIERFDAALAGVESVIAGMPQIATDEAAALAAYLEFQAP